MDKPTSANLAVKLANDETLRGGILKCNRCGKQRNPKGVHNYFLNGWPKCCDYTMTFITERQLREQSHA